MKLKKINELKFENNVGGGMKNQNFDCSIGVIGLNQGKVQVEGLFNVK